MSDVNSEYSSTSSSHEIIERKYFKKSPQNEEQQTVVNVFSKPDPEKADKLVQTGSSTTSFKKSVLFNQRSTTKIKNPSNSTIVEDSEDCEQERETGRDYSKNNKSDLTKPLLLLVSENKSMESRNCARGNVNSKTSPDLTRKKLEVELKAAEEIAKLKENVIEKRLAFELASLEDNVDCITNKKPSQPHLPSLHDKKCMEEPPKKMVPPPQEAMAQEREICYKYAYNPVRPILPTASGCARKHSPMAIKISRTDSTSSVLAAFKNLSNFTEKKFNFDKKFGAFNDNKCPSPTTLPPYKNLREFNCIDSSCEMAKRHTEYHQNNTTKMPSESRNRARIIWKSAMTKIKNKIRPKTPPA